MHSIYVNSLNSTRNNSGFSIITMCSLAQDQCNIVDLSSWDMLMQRLTTFTIKVVIIFLALLEMSLSLDDYASNSQSGFQRVSTMSVNSLSPKPLQSQSSPSTNMSHSSDNSLSMPQSSAGNVVSFPPERGNNYYILT